MNKATLILASLLICTGIWAQSPQGFNYQTVVRDNTGEAITSQAVSFRISILENGMTGVNIYSELQNTFTNEFGLATFIVGQGSSLNGDFTTIEWGQNEHFVQIELDATGGTNYQMMGTSKLMSVPYALSAAHAENVFSGDYNDLSNAPAVPTNVSDLNNDAGFISDPNDADNNPTNELQFLTLFGDSLYISNSNHVALPKRFSGKWIDLIGVPANIDLNKNDDFSGSWNDLTNVPPNIDWDTTDDFSGSWNDLSNVPPNIDLDVSDDFSGDFGDLTNVPSDVSFWFNDAGYITDPDDADASPTNEIQNLSLVGDTIMLSSGGQVVLPPVDYSDVNNTPTNVSAFTNDVGYITDPDDADASPTNEIQNLSLVGDTIMLSSGGQVVLPPVDYSDVNNTPTNVSAFTNDVGYITDPTDADASVTNEIQTLSITSDTIMLSSGGQVVIPPVDYSDVNNTPTNVSAFTNDVGYITDPTDADASVTNEIQTLSITSDTIMLSSGGQVVIPPVDYSDVNNTPTNVSAFTNDVGYITDPTDADASVTNEIQSLSIVSDTIMLSSGGQVVLPPVDYSDVNNTPTNVSAFTNDVGYITDPTDADASVTNEIQSLSIVSDTIMLSSGGQVVLPPVDYSDVNNTPTNVSAFTNDVGYITDPTDADASVTNEIQTMSISNDTITLTSGGQVVIPTVDYSDVNNTPTNVSAFTNDVGYITDPTDADASVTNELQTVSKTASIVTLSNGGGSFVDDVNDADSSPTNEHNISGMLLGNALLITDGGGTLNVDLSSLDDADQSTTNEIQTMSISNDTITLTSGGQVIIPTVDYSDVNNTPTNVSAFTNDAGYITDPTDADASVTNEIQTMSISNDTITLTSGGQVVIPAVDYADVNNTPTNVSAFTNDAGYITDPTDADASVTNEIQTMSISNDTITLTSGGQVVIPAVDYADVNNTPSNVSAFTNDAGYVTSSSTNTMTNKTFNDNTTLIQDDVDNSKKVQLQLSGISTATTRTLFVPNANTTIVGTDIAQTITNKTIDGTNNTISNVGNSSISIGAAIDATKLADGSVSSTELQYINSVTSNVQTQLNSKITASSIATMTNKTISADNNTITNIDNNEIKAAAAIDATKLADGTVSSTEFQYINSVTSNVQDQIDSKMSADSAATMTNKTIDADNNTVTNIDNSEIKAAAAIDASKLADGTVSSTEFQYLNSVTSNVQTQLDSKISAASTATLTNKTIDADNNTVSNIDNSEIKAAAAIDATKLADGTVSSTEFQYINSVTSNVQTQLDSKLSAASTSTMTNKTIDADNNTVTNIDNNEIKAAAAIDASKLADGTVSSTEFQYINSVTSNVQTQLDSKLSAASTATLTNKTIDADNNTVSNIDNGEIKAAAAIDVTKLADGSVTNTEFQYIGTVTSNVQTQLDNTISASSTATLTNKTIDDATTYMQDNLDNTKKVQFQLSGLTTATTRVITIPDANTTMVGTNATQTMTNKSIDADNNTITNIDNADIKAGAALDASKLANGTVSNTEFQYLANVTSDVQTQLNTKITAASTSTLTNKTVDDATTFMQDNLDNTKKVQFQLSGLSTATTRTITIPDVDMTLVGLDATQTVTNKTFTNVGQITIGSLTPTAGTVLDINSTTGAVLFPRMTTTERDVFTPVNGMIIYNTTTSTFQGYAGGVWVSF